MNTIDKDWVEKHIDSNGEVIIPNGVEKIEAQAFAQNINVKRVIMPDSITEIGDKAFALCENLETIQWSRNIRTIEGHAFYGCKSLLSAELPDTLETIKRGTFRNCSKLEKVNLGNGIKTIEHLAFDNTGIAEIQIPDSVESVGLRAFANCPQLKSINGAKGIKEIETQAFMGTELTKIEIPIEVKEIMDLTYGKNANLRSVKLNGNLKYISERAFEGTNNLQQVEIDGTSRIRFGTFFEKDSIRHITIDGQKIDLEENEKLFNIQKTGEKALVITKNEKGEIQSRALDLEKGTIKQGKQNLYLDDEGKVTYAIENLSECSLSQLEILKEKGINQLYIYGGTNVIRPSEQEQGLNFNLYSMDELIQIKTKMEEIKEKISIPNKNDKDKDKKIYAQIVNILGNELEYDHWEAEDTKEKFERVTRKKL